MDKVTYAILNKRIKSGGGSGGGTSVYVQNCTVNDAGNLIVTLSDGSSINAGKVTGENGVSPTIEIYTNTADTYQLKINNGNGSSFITPNLRGTGGATTRYKIFDNAIYSNYVDSIYTVYNGTLKSVSDYITAGSGFCHENNNYALYYNPSDFSWAGSVISFNTIPMTISSTQLFLYSYISQSIKGGEYIKFIPASLVTGETNLEKAQSIQTLLSENNSDIITIDFEFVYATNGVTEAVSLSTVPDGDYYVAWTATSDNSMPKINDITIV